MLERLTQKNKDELAQKEGNTLTKCTRRAEVIWDRGKQSTQQGTITGRKHRGRE